MANQSKSPAPRGALGPARLQAQGSPGNGSSGTDGGKAGNGGKPKGQPSLPRDAAGSLFTAQPPTGAARTVSMAMPPILLQQFRMFYAKDRPLGAILWAYVNDEVEQRLLSGNARMRPQDWKCGDKLWVVEVVAPFGGTDEMLKDLKAKVFPAREVRFRAVEGGKGAARVL